MMISCLWVMKRFVPTWLVFDVRRFDTKGKVLS